MRTDLVERSLDAGNDLWKRDFNAESLGERDLSDDLWAREFEDVELFEREVDGGLWDRSFDEDGLVARTRLGRDTNPPPIRPRPAPITITVQPPTPLGSGANSPARHARREELYEALVARVEAMFDELN